VKGKVIYRSRGNVYFVDDKEVTKEVFDKTFPPKPLDLPPLPGHTPSCWPMRSDALAVHPDQIPEVMERNKRHGVHVEYDPKTGEAILADRGQRRDLNRIEGFHDRRGGYGD